LAYEVELEVEYVSLLVHQVLLVLALDLHALELLTIVLYYRVLQVLTCSTLTLTVFDQALNTATLLVSY